MSAYTNADVRAASIALHAMWTSHPDLCVECKDDVIPVLDAVAPAIAARAKAEALREAARDVIDTIVCHDCASELDRRADEIESGTP